MPGALALALLLAASAVAAPARSEAGAELCPVAADRRPVPGAEEPLLPADTPPGGGGAGAAAPDYRHQLRRTPLGWARLDRWCVWVQPPAAAEPAARWDRLWLTAVERALDTWATWLPITRVADPEAAQIRIERRRPPLRRDADGRTRASHGRASLTIQQVLRQGQWRVEPEVTVQLGASQRPEALQATALHELGHAFGLWGHSDVAADVMAPAPGPRPALQPTPRDRETLRWLYAQPTPFGGPLPPAAQGS